MSNEVQQTATVWPMIFGAILAILGGVIGTIFQTMWNKRLQRTVVRDFALDLIDSFDYVFGKLDEQKKQSGIIWLNILDRIISELSIYERNREHLIAIPDRELRRKLQDIFTKIGVAASNIRFYVSKSLDENRNYRLAIDSGKGDSEYWKREADFSQKRAEESYQDLKELITTSKEIRSSLENTKLGLFR